MRHGVKDIGGYFELETGKGQHPHHTTPHALKSGRASLHYILKLEQPTLVYIPFYTCDALLEPFRLTGTPYRYYATDNNWEPAEEPELKQGEYFVYINYLGIKDKAAERLSAKYGHRLITDCTQAYFMKGNGVSWYFNSCRKFFGVPDGSYMYTPAHVHAPVITEKNKDYITDHLLKRFNGHTREGYASFVRNEHMMNGDLLAMSELSGYLLSGIDNETVINTRRGNYAYLHSRLHGINQCNIYPETGSVPMCYPLIPATHIDTHSLAAQRIYIPTYWKDVQERGIDGFGYEKELAGRLLPLPVDHRYTTREMDIMANAILKAAEQG